MTTTMRRLGASTVLALALHAPVHAAPPDTVFLEELTWPELRDAQRAGKTTVIIPVGGTEQSGPQLALGKHNVRVQWLAQRIAQGLGNAIVAPVVTYVPEGSWERPTGHMSKAGSITLPEERFRTLLELIARSLRGSGFKEIILIGDSGGNQNGMNAVATKLNAEWKGTGVRLHFIGDYYTKAHAMQQNWLADSAKIIPRDSIGGHANIMDTSELLYIHPELVHPDRYAIANSANGVSGSPAKSTREIGKKLLDIKIGLALAQIRQSLAAAPPGAEKF